MNYVDELFDRLDKYISSPKVKIEFLKKVLRDFEFEYKSAGPILKEHIDCLDSEHIHKLVESRQPLKNEDWDFLEAQTRKKSWNQPIK